MYGVDFEELKAMNTQLSSPDMIMPGMKIKVPGSSKAVKKETIAKKETKKETVKPYKDTSPKPIAAIQEDDHKVQKPVTPEMPVPAMPQMPILDQDINQYTTINFPQMPQMKPHPVKEEKKEVKKEYKPQPVKQKPIHQPIQPLQPIQHAPVHEPPIHHQPMMQPSYAPMVPVCCHHFQPPCCQPMPMPCHHSSNHFGGQMAPAFAPPVEKPKPDCGCGGGQMIPYPNQQMDPYPSQQMNQYPSQQMNQYPSQQMDPYPSQQMNQYPNQQMDPYPSQQMNQYPNQQMDPYPSQQMNQYPNQQMNQYPNQQMESNTHMRPEGMPELSSGGGMYPSQFGNMQEDGDFYPNPPSLPNFRELSTDNGDDKQDE